MKRLISILLVLSSIMGVCGLPTFATTNDGNVMPCDTNVRSTQVTAEIANDGIISIEPYCYALPGTTLIEASTYLEFQTGWTWTRISNGQPNNEWESSTTALIFSETYTYQLQMSGTFRVTTAFEVARNGSSEIIIVHSEEFSYSPY